MSTEGTENPPTGETTPSDPPKNEAQEAPKAKDDSGNTGPGVNVVAQQVVAPNAKFANQINETRKSYHYHQATSGETTSVPLSPEDHFDTIGPDRLDRLFADLLFDRGQLEQLTGALEEKRILTLVGRPEVGKTSFALLIAARLRQRFELHGAMLCRTLDGNVRVDINALTGDEPEYHGHVVIIKNALSRSGSDLSRFLDGLTSLRLDSCRERLAASNTYIVLTASQGETSGRPDAHGILQEVPPPPPSLLHQGIERRMRQWLLDQPPQTASSSAVEALLQEQREHMAAQLGSLSRIDRFVREYLPEVLAGRLSLAEALQRIDDLDRWLLMDLPADPEAWCAVLALTLCSAAPMLQSVPWLQFEGLRRQLSRLLIRELHEARRKRTIQELCQGWTLARVRAEIVRAPFPEPEGIRFKNPEYPERLWRALLDPGRSLLSLLLPFLRELASGKDAHLRQCAARALGQIGQIDPPYVVQPFVLKALGEESWMSLGHFYQGILGAEDAKYRDGCLSSLRRLFRGDDKEASLALRSLRQIGLLDLPFAIRELRSLAEDRLEIQWTELRKTSEGLRLVEELIRNLASPKDVIKKLLEWSGSRAAEASRHAIRELMEKVEDPHEVAGAIKKFRDDAQWLLPAQLVPEDKQEILAAIQSVIVGLFRSHSDHGPLLRELLAWTRSEKKDAAALVCFLFLHPGGLAPFLEDLSTATEGSDRRACSPVLYAARTDPDTAAGLRDLLEEVFLRMAAFPGAFRQQMEERFRHLLAAWAREAKDLPAVRPAVGGLLAGLFESRHNELSSWVLRLARDPEVKKEGEALKTLSIEAITSRRTPQRTVPAS